MHRESDDGKRSELGKVLRAVLTISWFVVHGLGETSNCRVILSFFFVYKVDGGDTARTSVEDIDVETKK